MTERQMAVFTIIVLLSCNALLLHGHKILLLPAAGPSHVRQLSLLGEMLIENGHEVHMGLTETFPPMDFITHSKVKMIKHSARLPDMYTMDQAEVSLIFQKLATEKDAIASWRENEILWENMCSNPLSDVDFFKTLAEQNFDLAIVDSFPMSRCLLLLPYDLNLPFVSVTTVYEPWLMRSPALPSFVPSNILSKVYTDQMSFFERFYNLWQNVDWYMAPRINFLDETFLKKHIRNKEKITINEIAAKSLLFFIDTDPVIDYPRPTMPNEINIGGMSLKPVQPLSGDLRNFIDASEDGVILFTFGSGNYDLPSETLKDYLNVFSQVKYRIVWKYHKDVPSIPPNVIIAKWLPQSDILAHPNTKIFITHCGNGGQFEALYHGVPMIGLPMYGDQPYNCKRMETLGLGICLNTMHVTTQELVTAIEETSKNDTYRENIQLASEIYKDKPQSAQQKFVFWINHILKFGGKHLRSHALDMPWYQYLMLDIFAFLFSVIALLIVAVSFAVNRLIKYQTKN